jgi:hypothetical protein
VPWADRRRLNVAPFVILTLFLGLSGCAAANPTGHALGCSNGRSRLAVRPSSAEPGHPITLTASGPWHVPDVTHDVTTSSYGLFGYERDGRFVPMYYLAAVIVPGMTSSGNIRDTPSAAVGGVGLPDRPIRADVPAVRPGTYIIEFTYTSNAPGRGRHSYNLCTKLDVVRS